MNATVKNIRFLAFAINQLVFTAAATATEANSPYLDATVAASAILEKVNQKNDLQIALDEAIVMIQAAGAMPDGSLADMVTQLARAIADGVYAPSPLLSLKGRSESGRKAVARVRFKLHRMVDHAQALDSGVAGDPYNEALQLTWMMLGAIDSEKELPIVRPLSNLVGQITVENIDRPGMERLARLTAAAIQELATYEEEVANPKVTAAGLTPAAAIATLATSVKA